MQAIMTHYLAPTNTQGPRIVARCNAMRIVVPWDVALNIPDNYRRAAATLVTRLGWDDPRHYGHWHLGALPGNLPDGQDYAYVSDKD